MEHFLLSDLVSTEILQELQDAFTDYTGISALITDINDTPVTRGTGFTQECYTLLKNPKVHIQTGEDNSSMNALLSLQSGKLVKYHCPGGLTEYAVPIIVKDELTGIFISGPLRSTSVPEEDLHKIAEERGFDIQRYLNAVRHATPMDEAEAERTVNFIARLVSVISKIASDKLDTLRQKEQVENSARTQSDYLQRFSGNLKQNLIDLADFLESVKNSPEKDENTDSRSLSYATVLATNTMSLGSMLDETIDVMQIEGGNFELKEAVYDIRQMLEQKLNEFRIRANETRNIVSYHINDNVPQQLMGDVSRVSTILGKFIENSLTYTEGDSIHVDVSCEQQGYATLLKLRIADNGIGIEESQMHQIRDYIMSRGISQTKNDEFEDLGFALIGYAVNAMYGNVEVESKVGEGTIFTVTIPQLAGN